MPHIDRLYVTIGWDDHQRRCYVRVSMDPDAIEWVDVSFSETADGPATVPVRFTGPGCLPFPPRFAHYWVIVKRIGADAVALF